MKKLFSFILALVLLFSCGCVSQAPAPNYTPASQKLTAYFLDVGQADCIFMTLGEKSMLIDGGNPSDAPKIMKFIEGLGISTIDTVVATHSHEDHVGGLGTIIDNFTVNNIYSPVNKHDTNCFEEFVDAANRQNGLKICARGMSWSLGDAKVDVLSPKDADTENVNNTSIVLKVTYNAFSFLLTGDAELEAESEILDSGADVKANVLKVGHHGSESSTSYRFLSEVYPQVAVISCGKNNSYGHPDQETIDILEQAKIPYYRTDERGTIVVSTDGKDFDISFDSTPMTTPSSADSIYIGNKSSKKFHINTCSGLPTPKNQVKLQSREQAISLGYTPCGICKP